MLINCAYSNLISINSLKPNPQNPNRHPSAQIKLLAKIMTHQGWRSPVVVSKLSGFVIKGHGRLEAAKLNGWTEVPIDLQDYASRDDELADMVADNQIAELATSDLQMIQEIALELGPGFDLDLLGILDFKVIGVDTLPPETSTAKETETIKNCPQCGFGL